MDSVLMRDMILNASLLLTISIIYNSLFIKQLKKKKLYDALMGVVIGIVGILLMTNAVDVSSGIIFDTRSILISTTGMFFGFIPTLTAVLIIRSRKYLSNRFWISQIPERELRNACRSTCILCYCSNPCIWKWA